MRYTRTYRSYCPAFVCPGTMQTAPPSIVPPPPNGSGVGWRKSKQYENGQTTRRRAVRLTVTYKTVDNTNLDCSVGPIRIGFAIEKRQHVFDHVYFETDCDEGICAVENGNRSGIDALV